MRITPVCTLVVLVVVVVVVVVEERLTTDCVHPLTPAHSPLIPMA